MDAAESKDIADEIIRAWHSGADSISVKTSGSTGPPKIISLSREMMIGSAERTRRALNPDLCLPMLLAISPRTIGGLMMVIRHLIWGNPLTVQSPSSRPMLGMQGPFSLASFVPFQLRGFDAWPEEEQNALGTIKTILLGGSAVPEKVLEIARKLPRPIYQTYGMTETASHIALRRINGPQPRAYFSALPGIEISLDARGCICVSGHDGPRTVITNDVAEILSPGNFIIRGRIDNVIISGGIKIHPELLEGEIDRHQILNRPFMIAPLPHPELGQAAVLIAEGEADPSILQTLKLVLPRHHSPRSIIFLPQFRWLPGGKIDRGATLSLALENTQLG